MNVTSTWRWPSFAFAPARLGQIGHLQVLMSGWMPLALLGLHEGDARPGLELATASPRIAISQHGRKNRQATRHTENNPGTGCRSQPAGSRGCRKQPQPGHERCRQHLGDASGDQGHQKTHAVGPDQIADLDQFDPAVLRVRQVIPTETGHQVPAQ
jgi:hypothetical protein